MNLTIIAGTRPNFVKIAPIIEAIKKKQAQKINIQYRLIHTGQHYDQNMSGSFFEELNIPKPNINLGVGGGSQAEQTAAIMVAFEKELIENPADLVIVVGDVNSTMACAIVTKKLNTKVVHVEAGIRSFDLSMPEEINRMVTDSITDYFFTTSELANQNLHNIGIPKDRIFFVGNVMIDTLLSNQHRFRRPNIYTEFKLQKQQYIIITLHRPANVDETEHLKAFIHTITNNVQGLPVIFPIHPRTAAIYKNAFADIYNLHVTDPLGYLEFNYLVQNSKAVITDSGGITEETTVMGVPCLTLRDNTERPETCTTGTNMLVGTDHKEIPPALERLFSGQWQNGNIPELWDGKTSDRIINTLLQIDLHG